MGYQKRKTKNQANRKPNSKPNETGRDDRNNTRSYDCNDPSWYYPSDDILNSYARLPINVFPGIGYLSSTMNGQDKQEVQVPGIMSIHMHEAIGPAKYMTDPVNQAAFELWTHIRREMSGSSLPTDPADIMMYVLGVRSIYGWLSSLIKTYGLLTRWNWENYYLPKLLIESEGFDYDDLTYNRPNFYAFLVESINKANRFILPSEMTIFNRTVQMSEKVYFDATTLRSQIYDFVWDNHYKYIWNGETGTTLVDLWPSGRPTGMKFADIVAYTNELINSMYTNEDVGTISGYMSKAFADKRIVLGVPSEDYQTELDFREEILSEIQNIKFYGNVVDSTISQNPNLDDGRILTDYIVAGEVYNPWMGTFVSAYGSGADYMSHASAITGLIKATTNFVFHHNDVGPTDWIIASRLSSGLSRDSLGVLSLECGTEYVTKLVLHTISKSTGIVSKLIIPGTISRQTRIPGIFNTLTALAGFRYAPEYMPVYGQASGDAVTWTLTDSSAFEHDVDAYIDMADLSNLHRCAVLGEFKI